MAERYVPLATEIRGVFRALFAILLIIFTAKTWAINEAFKAKCETYLRGSDWRSIVEEAAPIYIDGTEVVHGLYGANASIKREVNYKNGKVTRVRQLNVENGETSVLTQFNPKGQKNREVAAGLWLPGVKFEAVKEFENGRTSLGSFKINGVVLDLLDTHGGRLHDWSASKLRIWDADEKRTVEYVVNASLRKTITAAELITEGGQVLARAALKNGQLDGAYTFYDPGHLELPMIRGQFRNGYRVGEWHHGLSRPSLEKMTTEYDDLGRMIYVDRPNSYKMMTTYNTNGNRVQQVIENFVSRETCLTTYDPFTQQVLASEVFDRAGNRKSQERYSRLDESRR